MLPKRTPSIIAIVLLSATAIACWQSDLQPSFNDAVGSLCDPNISRQVILTKFEAVARDPQRETGYDRDAWVQYDEPFLKESIGILKTMVQEDAKHAKKSISSLDRLPLKEKIAELVYRLRDQGTDIWINPDAITDVRTSSPDYQLFRIGEPAIPALWALRGDRRFTRASNNGGRGGQTRPLAFQPIRIGHAAMAILRHIFHPYLSQNSGLGERELANAVRIGGDPDGKQAFEFAMKYPARAREVLIQGLNRTLDVKRQPILVAQLTLLNPDTRKRIADWYERFKPETLNLVLQELGTELYDTTPCRGCSIQLTSGTYHEPRMCDLAAEMLNIWMPRWFKFDIAADPKERADRLADCQARWKEHNLLVPAHE